MTVRPRSAACLAVAALCFVLLATRVLPGGPIWGDTELRAALHASATPALTGVMWAITCLGAEWLMIPLGGLLIWRLTATGRGRAAIRLATATLSAEAASLAIKLLLHRPRPAVFFGLPPAGNFSFPSGHAFVATVFYGLIAGILVAGKVTRTKRNLLLGLAGLAALLIGVSRVYLGYHYPSDVLGGWAAAVVWLCLADMPELAARKH